ncbi:MAG: hypothetical protein ACR2GY_00065 [Phycisphaerales bacterium]
MLIYAGIDEAGYGPILGPLCVAASVFALPDRDPAQGAPSLWNMLRSGVSRAGRDNARRIAIDDSKKLKGAPGGREHPLRRLERGVLCMAAVMQSDRALAIDGLSDATLLEHVRTPSCAALPGECVRHPCALPIAITQDEVRVGAAHLGRMMRNAGVELEQMLCRVIEPCAFNRAVATTRNKATVNAAAVIGLIDAIWQRYPHAHPRILVDRLGGRMNYRELLQDAWPSARLTIVHERPAMSRYMIVHEDRALTVSFMVDADQRHLPVALASMTAKYLRELRMLRLNQFFQSHRPELKPTAGYHEDGRRFLEEVEDLVERLGLDRQSLVRMQ